MDIEVNLNVSKVNGSRDLYLFQGNNVHNTAPPHFDCKMFQSMQPYISI